MKNNFINTLIILLLLTIFIFIFAYSNDIKENVLYAIDIWLNILIPSIFPFLLISNLLIDYNFINILSTFLGNITTKIFNLPKSATYVIITSIFTGFPTGSKYTKDLLVNNEITLDDANHLIMFSSFSNPLFVISSVGESLLKSKTIGYFIFISHLLTGLLIGILFKRKNKSYKEHLLKNKNNKNFITNLLDSINSTFQILINMLGIIIFFLIIIVILDKTLLGNSIFDITIKGLIEMTSGIKNISNTNISLRLKSSIIGFLISFSGLSVHFQVKSIIEGTKIKYKNFLLARIIHSILCFIIIYTFFNLFCSSIPF